MTSRAIVIAWALGGLALAAVLRAALPAFLRPLAVGTIAGGLSAQRGLDERGELRMTRALPATAGRGATMRLLAPSGAPIQGEEPA